MEGGREEESRQIRRLRLRGSKLPDGSTSSKFVWRHSEVSLVERWVERATCQGERRESCTRESWLTSQFSLLPKRRPELASREKLYIQTTTSNSSEQLENLRKLGREAQPELPHLSPHLGLRLQPLRRSTPRRRPVETRQQSLERTR